MSQGQKKVFLDLATNALIAIDYVHYEIHDGGHYEIKDVVDQAINAVRDIQITMPNSKKWAHLSVAFDSENECEWFLYRNVNIILAGTASNVQNSNHNSAKTSDLVIKHIDNASVANANADTAVAGATQIHHGITGTGQKAGDHNHAHEIILKQAEDYTLRLIAKAAGYVNYHFDWYEHINLGGDY